MKMEEVFSHTFKAISKRLDEQRAEGRRLWQQRLGTASEFCRAVVSNGYMTEEQMQRAAQRYRLGASRDGGVIFWQIDEFDQLRDGKIMHYRPDCHRDHDRKPTWASYLLRKSGQLPKDWNNDHCLFGLHLLAEEGRWKMADVKVAVVEAEKTAVIMSEVKPEYIWLATGGKTELNVAKLRPLEGRRIILFPDTDEDGQTYRDWYDVAEAASIIFLDASVRWLLSKSVDISLAATNLLDETDYRYTSFGSLSESLYSFTIRPRNIIIKMQIKI